MASPSVTAYFDFTQDNYIKRVDYDINNNAIYLGWALPGTLASDSAWRIVQNTYDGTNRFTASAFPSASCAFSFVWDLRTNYTYS